MPKPRKGPRLATGPDHERLLLGTLAAQLFTHERVRHTPRVRAVVDFLYEKLSKHVRRLEATRQAA